ncbi:unnamed protein product, partial [Allacma fusca]
MSKQLTPNLCLTAAYYVHLYDHLESYNIKNGHDPALVEAAKLACDKLNKYYPKSDGLVYIVGVVLNPRLKFEWHSQVGFKEMVPKYRRMITDLWKKEYKPQNGQMSVD